MVDSMDGARIAVECHGTGPPVVLVHGTLDDHRYWGPILPDLAKHFTVFVMNRRGRGGSSPHRPDHAVERDVEDVAAVANAIDKPAHLVGHSSGARYALHAAPLIPGLRSLTLYEPPPFESPPEAFLSQLERLTEAGDRDGIVTAFWAGMVGLPPEDIEEMRESSTWEVAASNAHTLLPELRSFAAYRFDPGAFATFDVPTLLLSGTESPPFLIAEVEELSAILPRSRVEQLEGQGHEAVHTAPNLFVSKLVSFLKEDS